MTLALPSHSFAAHFSVKVAPPPLMKARTLHVVPEGDRRVKKTAQDFGEMSCCDRAN